jgi:hypothetical protein
MSDSGFSDRKNSIHRRIDGFVRRRRLIAVRRTVLQVQF